LLPTFWVGLMMIMVFLMLGWLPSNGRSDDALFGLIRCVPVDRRLEASRS
jgi:ABC-type dipeptide/oligopeptide/nickel transport system permease component